MTNFIRCSLSVVALFALAGCVGTTPPRLYTLDMKRSGNAQPKVNIEVERLRPQDALSRGTIVIRRGEHEIDSYPLDTWASNLGELVAGKLQAEFGAAQAERATLTLSGDILSFEYVPLTEQNGEVRAALDLEIRKKGDSRYSAPLLTKPYEASAPTADATPTSVVAALTKAVQDIATAVATDINALPVPEAVTKSDTEHLHTLDMTPSGKTHAALNIDVTSLRRHEALARNSILVRAAPTAIEYYPSDRWAASVSTLVAEKLEAEFGVPVSGRDTVQLSGSILAFERVDDASGAKAHVKLDVTLQRSASAGAMRPMLWKVYEESTAASSTRAEHVAVALSQALATIAVSIAADVERIPAPKAPATAEPDRLYTLDMTPSGKAMCKRNVVFDRIAPHDSLTRADILIVRNQTAVEHFPNDRWASSLAELVPEKLSAEFGPSKDGALTVRVAGEIAGFEQVEKDGVRVGLAKLMLEYRWETGELPTVRKTYEETVPLDGDDASATVKALSRAMEAIAVHAAADIDALVEPAPAEPAPKTP